MKVFKYPLNFKRSKIPIRMGDAVVHVAEQGGLLMAWVLHRTDDDHPNTEGFAIIEVVATGEEVNDVGFHHSTTIDSHGFVWHIFIKYESNLEEQKDGE